MFHILRSRRGSLSLGIVIVAISTVVATGIAAERLRILPSASLPTEADLAAINANRKLELGRNVTPHASMSYALSSLSSNSQAFPPKLSNLSHQHRSILGLLCLGGLGFLASLRPFSPKHSASSQARTAQKQQR